MPDLKKTSPCHCINIRRVAGHITDYYSRAIEPCGLTVNQFSVLWSLDFLGRSNTTTLAEQVGLERSTLARNLKPLLSRGFIEDTAPAGRRDRMFRVTPKGKMALEIGIPLWQAAQKEINALIGPDKLTDFKAVLMRLQDI